MDSRLRGNDKKKNTIRASNENKLALKYVAFTLDKVQF